MCISGCLETVQNTLSRREFLTGAVAGGIAMTSTYAEAKEPKRAQSFPAFTKVVDLTYEYSSRFPHYAGRPSVVKKTIESSTAKGDDWNVCTWTMDEHAGTHIDSPFHRNAKGITVEKIPVGDLVLPLAVIDIKERAKKDHDAMVTVADIEKWEKQNGALPDGCCVAMNSGWQAHAFKKTFINLDKSGVRHFPGFGIQAAEFLFHKRNVVALASDTASIDQGASSKYPTHVLWLGGNRYALENVAALDQVPPKGATIVAGALKITGATGGHTRVIALV